MNEILLVAAVGVGAVAVVLTLRRPIAGPKHLDSPKPVEEPVVSKTVQVEEQPSPQVPVEMPAQTASKEKISDEDFKALVLSNKSVDDIAAACGYKSKSSVYRRMKKLHLSR